jgi:hypothetical protein
METQRRARIVLRTKPSAHLASQDTIKPRTTSAAPVQMMRTNPTKLLPEKSAHPTPRARHRKSKRKFQAPLKTASADSKHAAAPAARLPPEQPASEKPTITAPAAKKSIGSAATTTSAAHGRPAAAASTRLNLPTDRETASARQKRARAITAQRRQEPFAQRMANQSASHVPAATFSATTRVRHGRRLAQAEPARLNRRTTTKIANALRTNAHALMALRLQIPNAP